MATEHARISGWHNQLVPKIVDHVASIKPDAPYALYPNSPLTYDQGYRTVSYKDFANAINGIAWWLHNTLGPGTHSEVLAYIGPNDVRYPALVLGAVKAGYVAFFTSPRNSIPAHVAMFEKLKCRTLLSSYPTPPTVKSILSAHSMRHFQVPSVAHLLDKSYPPYPFSKTYETAKWEPLWVIHTSGSTGIPKPLVWTHETAARNMNFLAKDPPPGLQSLDRLHQGNRVLTTFPPFHGACLVGYLLTGVPFGSVFIAPLSGAIPTAEGVVEALKHAPADMAFLVPSIVSELSQDPGLLEYCANNIKLILYAGGDLPQQVGDTVASKVPLHCQYGASEIGLTAQLLHPDMKPSDWRYVLFHLCLGMGFDEVTDGVYEMTIKRDPRKAETQSTFTIGPSLRDLDEYRTRDLFRKHPVIPDLWCWQARADDIIVFLNGEKTNPVPMEQHILARNVDVAAVLVVGTRRFQGSLLIEPAAKLVHLSESERGALIQKVWPSVEEANQVAPTHARIEKTMILLTSPEKPVIRAGKGTIQRQASISQYEEELEALYENTDAIPTGPSDAEVDVRNAEDVSRFIQYTMATISPAFPQGNAVNFFEFGMDSLQAMRLTRALKQSLRQPSLSLSTIYHNPSVPQLTRFIVDGHLENDGPKQQSEPGVLQNMLNEYTEMINQIPRQTKKNTSRSTKETVILTGSTGSLGTYLLQALLKSSLVTHVYCLDRRADSQTVCQSKAADTCFPLENHSKRVTFLHAFLDKPELGLDEKTCEKLRAETTLIIHNAWALNFNLSLSSFRPQLDGLVNLFRLSASSSHLTKIFFISSVSSIAALHRVSQRVPEAPVRSSETALHIGYAQSKLLGEMLCDEATRCLHIPVSFARVAQIAGPVLRPGLWNPSEWLPSLMVSSMHLGVLPDALGGWLNTVDWIPVDLLADTIVQLASGDGERVDKSVSLEEERSAEVFNVCNPRSTSWAKVLPTIVSSLEKLSNKRTAVVPISDWLAKVQQSGETDNDEVSVRANPAVKLLDFYTHTLTKPKALGGWETERATARSKTLREMSCVGS
ncbi:acetyl-CoA synthetase-like protein [Periconia macrospinosa]|uniref:Acetyl-CoA synthetase-like protein n=1 Tax=Periconia macrospinosa TaxID=97972 RepID=A0A2V1DS61_9PLEO|nr:acetyl-CoA synthetase-like protein [Periconia macrospinosa]